MNIKKDSLGDHNQHRREGISGGYLNQWHDRRDRVDVWVNEWLNQDVPKQIQPIVRKAMFPGRRSRPVLLQALCPEHEHKPSFKHASMAIELLHRASIVVDDIVDLDSERRTIPAYHITHGEDVAIIISHFLVSESNKSAASSDALANQAIAGACAAMCVGQLADIRSTLWADDPWTTYSNVVMLKTQPLFDLVIKVAAYFNATEHPRLEFLRLGQLIGFAYQLSNDIHDCHPKNLFNRQKKAAFRLTLNALTALACATDPAARAEFAGLTGRKIDFLEYSQFLETIATEENIVELQARLRSVVTQIRLTTYEFQWLKPIMGMIEALTHSSFWDHSETTKVGYKL